MSAHAHPRLSEEQYLAIERAARDVKSEFFDGRMHAMSGTAYRHALIVSNLCQEIGNAIRQGPCAVTTSDLRVRVRPGGLYTYPDLVVACGERQFVDDEFDTLLNPTLLIEVLSPSTESYDRGFKSAQYREIPSLREYALVSQTEPRVEIYLRQDGGRWLFSEAASLDQACTFASVGCTIPLSEVYRRVVFDEQTGLPGHRV